uniref:Putative secreted protein n=1 Tax=Anopheles darlingi TaxID=43151 RepID=A0A2M4DND5_ANODA
MLLLLLLLLLVLLLLLLKVQNIVQWRRRRRRLLLLLQVHHFMAPDNVRISYPGSGMMVMEVVIPCTLFPLPGGQRLDKFFPHSEDDEFFRSFSSIFSQTGFRFMGF